MSDRNHGSPLRIATRGSPLALWQADFVAAKLKAELGLDSERIVVKTSGDRIQDRFLHEIGGKGLFIKELEEKLLAGEADLAIHSLKDMPARLPNPFLLAACLPRHAPEDLLIFHPDRARPIKRFDAEACRSLGKVKIATGSLRRTRILQAANPQIEVIGIRGNVDTRIAKLRESDWEALILAKASLDRLQIGKDLACAVLDPTWFVPAPAQGILAIEMLSDHPAFSAVQKLDHPPTSFAANVERRVLAHLGGDCTLPYGCHVNGKTARALVFGAGADEMVLCELSLTIPKVDVEVVDTQIEDAARLILEKLLAADRFGFIRRLMEHRAT